MDNRCKRERIDVASLDRPAGAIEVTTQGHPQGAHFPLRQTDYPALQDSAWQLPRATSVSLRGLRRMGR